jgi:hypothetical protein
MKVNDSENNYKLATLAIYCALTAKSRPAVINLGDVCKVHKISTNYPATLRAHGYIMGERGKAFWNPEKSPPSDAEVLALQAETVARMNAWKVQDRERKARLKNEPPSPVLSTAESIVPGVDVSPVVQGWLPLTAPSRKDEFISALSQLHRATTALLGELGGAA